MRYQLGVVVGLLLLCGFLATCVHAKEELLIHDAWIREAPPNAMALAGYMTIVNSSNAERSLTVATSPVFGWIELHRTVHDGDVAKMVPQDAIKIPAGGRVELKPGDYHLMLMQPSQTLRVGDQISITLEFKNGEMQTINFPVKKQTLSEKIESGAEEKPK